MSSCVAVNTARGPLAGGKAPAGERVSSCVAVNTDRPIPHEANGLAGLLLALAQLADRSVLGRERRWSALPGAHPRRAIVDSGALAVQGFQPCSTAPVMPGHRSAAGASLSAVVPLMAACLSAPDSDDAVWSRCSREPSTQYSRRVPCSRSSSTRRWRGLSAVLLALPGGH